MRRKPPFALRQKFPGDTLNEGSVLQVADDRSSAAIQQVAKWASASDRLSSMSDVVPVHCPQCAVKLKLKVASIKSATTKITCPKCEASFVIGRDVFESVKTGQETISRTSSTLDAGSARPKAELLGLSEISEDIGFRDPGIKPEPRSQQVPEKSVSSKPAAAGTSGQPAKPAQPPKAAVASPAPAKAVKAATPVQAAAPAKAATAKSVPAENDRKAAVRGNQRPAAGKPAIAKPSKASAGQKSKRRPVDDETEFEDDWTSVDSLDDDDWAATPEEADGSYEAPSRKLPARAGSGKGAKLAARGESVEEMSRWRQMGVMGWFLFGALGGGTGAGITVASGFSGNDWIIGAMALVTGLLTGIGVRYGAGFTFGFGPAIVAGLIGLTSILGGKVGAYYLTQNYVAEEEEEVSAEDQAAESAHEEKMLARITSDSAMIAEIAGTVNEEWLANGQITEQQQTDYFNKLYERRAPEDPSKNYLPEVWEEGRKRWAALSPEQKNAKYQEIRQEWYGDGEGDPNLNQISELNAVTYLADEVQDEWLESERITDEQIERHMESLEEPVNYEQGFLPEVWQEATSRWAAKPEAEKQAARDKARADYQTMMSVADVFFAHKGLTGALLLALLNCVSPKLSLACLIGGMSLAWRVGGHGAVTAG
jgi:hypothetical protein